MANAVDDDVGGAMTRLRFTYCCPMTVVVYVYESMLYFWLCLCAMTLTLW